MFNKNVWVLVLFNSTVVFCFIAVPAKNCMLDFNDDKNAIVVKWNMKSNHNVTHFVVSLVIHSWNKSVIKNETTSFANISDYYEHKISVEKLPATTYKGTVISCNDDTYNNCKIGCDRYSISVPPNKPEINATRKSCDHEVCRYRALVNNAITNCSLYVLEKQKAEQMNFTNDEETIVFLNESSILVVNISKNTEFKIDISKYCDDTISLVAVNTYKNCLNFSDIKPLSLPLCKTSYNSLIVLLILSIIIVILVGLLVYFKCRKRWNEVENSAEMAPLQRHPLKLIKRVNASRELDTDSLHEFLTMNPDVKEMLVVEYTEIPSKLYNLFGTQHGTKNRYFNILPYEYNRVKIFSNPSYDYINASYIKGYSKTQKYIATQGPLRNSIDDFWGMIWDLNVDKIVMLTNFKEHGQVKCDEYWLEDQTQHLSNMMIVHHATKSLMDFKIRDFSIIKGNNKKVVTHYHFTKWLDDIIPHDIDSLIKFIKIIRESNSGKATPIVVHCSAGVGRTGVFILCDYLLDMYKDKRYVDIPHALHNLRNFRLNLVKNELQYIFTYCLVNEYLKEKTTEIRLETLFETMQIFTQEINLMNDVETTARKDYLLDVLYTNAIHFGWENNKHKHRTAIPPKNCNGFISLQRYPLDDEESYYTPAVKIPNQTNTKTYISTIQPLPETAIDFWRLVEETNTSIILSLHEFFNDSSSVVFWPTSAEHDYNPCSYLRISFTKIKTYKGFVVVKLCMYIKSRDLIEKIVQVRPVYVLHFHEWNPDSLPNVDKFSKYFKHYVQLSKLLSDNAALIACSDGIRGCGPFLTFLFVIEKISHENIFDLCGRVNILRYYLNGIMTKPNEYKFIYECVQMLYETENNNLLNFYT